MVCDSKSAIFLLHMKTSVSWECSVAVGRSSSCQLLTILLHYGSLYSAIAQKLKHFGNRELVEQCPLIQEHVGGVIREVMEHVLTHCGEIHPFLVENPDISPATRQHLLVILNDPNQLMALKLKPH